MRQALSGDIAVLMAERRPTPWLRSLAEGRSASVKRLAGALHDYHAHAVAPFWRGISRRVDADRALRARTLLDHGLDRLLSTLHPAVQWKDHVLVLPYGRYDRDLHLGGRGLLLVPSFFCWGTPVSLRDPSLAPVLVYSIDHTSGSAAPTNDLLAHTVHFRAMAGPPERIGTAGRKASVHNRIGSKTLAALAGDGGGGPFPNSGVADTAESRGLEALSMREQQVLALMAQGLSNEAITQRLGVGGRTVETYVGNIFAKLDLEPSPTSHRRVQAVLAYLQANSLPDASSTCRTDR